MLNDINQVIAGDITSHSKSTVAMFLHWRYV
jgi:hypothetical protein